MRYCFEKLGGFSFLWLESQPTRHKISSSQKELPPFYALGQALASAFFKKSDFEGKLAENFAGSAGVQRIGFIPPCPPARAPANFALMAVIHKIKMPTKFAIVLPGMTLLCMIVWDFAADRLYDCTDPIGPGFLPSGDWVHNRPGQPIVAVAKVTHDHEMGEPDTLKAGWSVTKLWCLWFALAGISLAVSFILSRKPWPWFSDAIIESKRQHSGTSQ